MDNSPSSNENPLAVTVRQACQLSGLGATSIWACLKEGRLEAVRVAGLRRTLVGYASLARFLTPEAKLPSPPRRRGRPPRHRKSAGGAS